jgi:hypothetical protein
MCFSASGSFGVAAIIAATGAVAVGQKHVRAHRLLATVPLLFAAQQITEGVVWLTLRSPTSVVHRLAVAVFLGMAVVIWPTWMPLGLLVAESRPRRRRTLAGLTALGVLVSIYAGSILMRALPVARVAGHSLAYSYAETGNVIVLSLYLPLYALATVAPFMISSMTSAKIMGALLAVGLVATFVIKRDALVSTWCFFAAILSAVIAMSVAAEHRLAPPALLGARPNQP